MKSSPFTLLHVLYGLCGFCVCVYVTWVSQIVFYHHLGFIFSCPCYSDLFNLIVKSFFLLSCRMVLEVIIEVKVTENVKFLICTVPSCITVV